MTASRRRRAREPNRVKQVTRTIREAPRSDGLVETEGRALRIRTDGADALELPSGAAMTDLRVPGTLLWIDVQGTANHFFFQQLGQLYNLHPLAIEDALHVHQRAKVEAYPNHLFIVARMVHFAEHVSLEQLAIFVGPDFVVTVQEGEADGDCFDPLRHRLKKGTQRPATTKPEHLAHALLDGIVDAYFPTLDAFGEQLELLEDDVLEAKKGDVLARIQHARRDVIMLRRALWPLRDALFLLGRETTDFGPDTRLYMRDTLDHVLRVIDLVEGYRETVGSMTELYMSTMSNRLNETMRLLAVISTIFIPLTFIAGVYGMNFDPDAGSMNMPELRSPAGYPVIMAIMALIGGGMLYFFWRRGWLGRRGGPPPS
ncbi:MAG: magnesium/cobalt transporter CorA [Deltaproteobacteria bacterium]|nr:magnesium/cobalt transporter CorA [Deltaproteobacteria bacterium]